MVNITPITAVNVVMVLLDEHHGFSISFSRESTFSDVSKH